MRLSVSFPLVFSGPLWVSTVVGTLTHCCRDLRADTFIGEPTQRSRHLHFSADVVLKAAIYLNLGLAFNYPLLMNKKKYGCHIDVCWPISGRHLVVTAQFVWNLNLNYIQKKKARHYLVTLENQKQTSSV